MEDSGPTLYCASCLTTFGSNGEACPNLGCGRERPEKGWGRMYQPGEVIDRNYYVEKTLALGGAGVTYLVRGLDEAGQPVDPLIALKLLFASRDHGAYLQRLATEAQILQQLDHPHIVEYLGFVHRSGHSPYLMTGFEHGGSLLDHMRRVGTLSIKAAASIGRQVCWALEKGHSRHIIHRDLKPENMLLTAVSGKGEDVHVRVADFGIAKVQGSLGSGLTRSGAFVGTPQYAAPEQFIGTPATGAADVYSLGAVLVFLMTARPVIKKAHLAAPEDIYLQLQDRLPATVQRNKDPEDDNRRMNTILAQVMQFDPELRCSVEQLDRMLEALLEDRDPMVEAPPSSHAQSAEVSEPMAPVEPPADESMETQADPSVPLSSQGSTQTFDSLTSPSAPAPKSGGGLGKLVLGVLVLLLLGGLGLGGAYGYVVWKMPWELEGQPLLAPREAHSLIGNTKAKAMGKRRTIKGKLKRVISDRWAQCGAKSPRPRKDVSMELVVEPDGEIRWMKAFRPDATDVHRCVAERSRGAMLKSWKSPRPLRVRVRVEFGKQ